MSRHAQVLGALAVLCVVDAPSPAPAIAQERCALVVEAENRRSVAEPGGDGAYTTYLRGNPVEARCGGAVMTGDSAVYYESEARAEMIGAVDYRDTTRTLSADRLTYFEASGQVVATGDVELVRLSTGARLEGPEARFFRAGAAGSTGRTLATGRPHMTIPPERGSGPPIEVDADEAEFIGEEIAIGRGDVVITRSDLEATADTAWFEGESGRLYGRPVISTRGMRLTGDSIHADLAGGGIDRVHAFGTARGEGETVELEAQEILVTWGDRDVERIEAFAGERALAGGEAFIIAGDSLDVAFTAGAADSVSAVGRARTFQLERERTAGSALIEPPLTVEGPTSWIEGDSIRAWLDLAGGSDGNEAAGEGGTDGPARIRRLLARVEARSYFAAVRDSTVTLRRSRNYMIGDVIDIRFEAGEPVAITADRAIGVFLEPTEGTPAPASRAAPSAGADGGMP